MIWYKSRKSFIPHIPFTRTENTVFRMKFVPNNISFTDSLFLSIHILSDTIYNFAPNHFSLPIIFRFHTVTDYRMIGIDNTFTATRKNNVTIDVFLRLFPNYRSRSFHSGVIYSDGFRSRKQQVIS